MPVPTRLPLVCALGLLASCHNSSGGDSTVPVFVGSVTITANDNAWVPHAAFVTLETDEPTRVELRFSDGTRTWDVTAVKEYATTHARVPVVGMRPGVLHQIEVTVRDQAGNPTAAPSVLTFTPPALPTDFPPIQVTTSMPAYMEDGVTLLSLVASTPGSTPTMIDAEGNVLWYMDCSVTPFDGDQVFTFAKNNGNLMLIGANQVMVEVNLLGDIVQWFYADGLGYSVPGGVPVATESFHHDFVEMPAGSDADYAVIGTEMRVLPNYPSSEVDPQQTVANANVVGDEIIEFTRDGTVVRRFRLLDLLDPYRMTYDTLFAFWDDLYGIPTIDWSHANAITLDQQTNSWIVSLRHQDCVFQVNRATGEVDWIMGDPARWEQPWSDKLLTPVGTPFGWSYHQHAPQLLPDGSILLYDNGNGRAIPPTPRLTPAQGYSRAVRYRVDPVARTVEQLWAYGSPPGGSEPSFYSFFVSSAYQMPGSGNVLVCDGGKFNASQRMHGGVFEVTTEPMPQVVFECAVEEAVPDTADYFIYRAYRLSGVYR